MKKLKIAPDWTLFLDRDGVLNERLPGQYIRNLSEFRFLPNIPDVIGELTRLFARIIIVTNQQGIGKGLMTVEDLESIHRHMRDELRKKGGIIDGIYFCKELAGKPGNCRKPSPSMGYQAVKDFPEIDFEKSVMVGDSITDIGFGLNLRMKTVLVGEKLGYQENSKIQPDLVLPALGDLLAVIE